MTNNIFASKEQYLNFRSAWAKAASEKNVTATDHYLFNVLTGRPVYSGFTPITNQIKVSNGAIINLALANACDELRFWQSYAVAIADAQKKLATESGLDVKVNMFSPYTKGQTLQNTIREKTEYLERKLAKFGGTVTVEMLKQLSVPYTKRIYSFSEEWRTFQAKVNAGGTPSMETLYGEAA